jgi:hypothetical protein
MPTGYRAGRAGGYGPLGIHVARASGHLRFPDKPAGWVRDAVRKRCRSKQREAWRSRRAVSEDDEPTARPEERAPARTASPEQRAALAEILAHPGMPLDVRASLAMIEEGWSWEETAAEVGEGRGEEAQRKRVERALARWRKDNG